MVADLCAIAPAHGIVPLLIHYDPDATGRQIAVPGVEVHKLDRRHPDFRRQLRRMLMDLHVDVLHGQGHIAAALAGPVMRDTPSIATIHVALGRGWRWAPAIARGLSGADKVVAVSTDLARRFRLLAGQAITVTPPGIDLDHFRDRDRRGRMPGQPFTIGVAARLHPIKRQMDAITAIRQLKEKAISCRLILAGQGPEEQRLRQAATGLDVHFCGDVSDMPRWFDQIDLFLLPSDHEGSPLALLEAMACGLPCVATAVGGIPAMTEGAVLLVPRRNPDAITGAVSQLLQDDLARTALSQAARKRAEAFSRERHGADMAALYRTLL